MKACIDCRFCTYPKDIDPDEIDTMAKCLISSTYQVISFVTGEKTTKRIDSPFCSWAKNNKFHCGPKAEYFKSK